MSTLFMCFIIFSTANRRSTFIPRSAPNRRELLIGDKVGPLLINFWDMKDSSSPHYLFPSLDILDDDMMTRPDYGGLEIEFQYARTLRPTRTHGAKIGRRRFDDEEEEEHKCQSVSWDQLYSPSCNMIHEFDLQRDEDEYDSTYLAHGYYRDVWSLRSRATLRGKTEDMVVKTLRIAEHDFKIHAWQEILLDALIMERLTGSPRIMNIYGHCGFTVTAETIEGELEEVIVPGDGVAKQVDLDKEDDVKPKNNFNVMEKLEIALTMAESIADLHGFRDGMIIHDDIQLCQWLRRTSDGKIVLGDFNRATIPKWNEERQEYCTFKNGYGYGEYRSPEEFAARRLDEKIDVFSFGNNIYGLLTGLWVFYDIEDDDMKQKKIIAGDRAYIDERYRNRSFVEDGLIDVMERCWEYEPEERIDIFKVVRLLRDILAKSKRYMEEDRLNA